MNDQQLEVLFAAVLLPLVFIAVEVAGRRSKSKGGLLLWARVALYLTVSAAVFALLLLPELVPFFMVLQLALLGGIVLLIVGALLYFKVVVTRTNRLLTQARELCEAGRSWQALDLLYEFLETPKRRDKTVDAAVLLTIADIYRAEERWPEAHAALDRAMRLDAEVPGVYSGKAEVLRAEGKAEAACEVLEAGRSRFPQSVQVHTAYAEVLAESGEHAAAQEALHTTERLLDEEQFLDILNRPEWREQKLKPLRQALEQLPAEHRP